METNQQSLIDGWFEVFQNESTLLKPEKNVDILRSLRSKEELDGFKPENIFSEMIEVIRKNDKTKRAFRVLIFKPGFKLTGYTFLGFVSWMRFEKGLELLSWYRGFLLEEVKYVPERFTYKQLCQMQEDFASTHHIPKYEGPLVLAEEVRAFMSKSYFNLDFEYNQDISLKALNQTGIYDGLEFTQEVEYEGKEHIIICKFKHHKTIHDKNSSSIQKLYLLTQERRTKKTPEQYKKFIDYPHIYREKAYIQTDKIFEWAIPDFIMRNGLEHKPKYHYNKWFDAVTPVYEVLSEGGLEYEPQVQDVFRDTKFNFPEYNTKEASKEELMSKAFGTHINLKLKRLKCENEEAPKCWTVLPHELGLKNGQKKSFSLLDDFEQSQEKTFIIPSVGKTYPDEIDKLLKDIMFIRNRPVLESEGLEEPDPYEFNVFDRFVIREINMYIRSKIYKNCIIPKKKPESKVEPKSEPDYRHIQPREPIRQNTLDSVAPVSPVAPVIPKRRELIVVNHGVIYRVKYVTRHYLHFSKLINKTK